MELTERYKLKKPGQDDHYDVQDFNDNADAIDAALRQHDRDIDEVFRVGNLRSTLRTDLGDRWLLCNGEAFDPAEYPELAEVIPGGLAAMGSKAKSRTVGTSPGSGFRLAAYATDGVNQLAAYTDVWSASSSATTNNIYWSNNNFRTYTKKTVPESFKKARIFFVNGLWIVFFGPFIAPSYISVISEPFSGASEQIGIGSLRLHDVFHIEYIDGIYYAFCTVMEPSVNNIIRLSFAVVSSSSPDFQNATTTKLGDAGVYGDYRYSEFCRMDDKFVFCYVSGSKIKNIIWSPNPSGPYQTRDFDQSAQQHATNIVDCTPLCVDGKIVWVAGTAPGSPSMPVTLVYLDDVENGEIKYTTTNFSYSAVTSSGLVNSGDGEYAFFVDGQKYIHVAKGDIFKPSSWTRGALNKEPQAQFRNLAYAYGGTVNVAVSGGILDISHAAVPTVSIANCYTYVKAK